MYLESDVYEQKWIQLYSVFVSKVENGIPSHTVCIKCTPKKA